MPYRRARSWREWFFEVFAPNGYMPVEPPPMTAAELLERAERDRQPMTDMTRLNLGDATQPSTTDD